MVSKKLKGGVQDLRKQVLNRIYDSHNHRDNSNKNNNKNNESDEALIIDQSNMPLSDHGIFGSNLSSLLSRAPV